VSPARHPEGAPPASRILVVSNRLPLTLRHGERGWRAEASTGGLVTALRPVIQRTGGLWIGWPGDATPGADEERAALVRAWETEKGYAAVDLPPEVAQRYYYGYANQTLWPVFHEFPSLLRFDPEGWEAYTDANRRFCDAVLARLRPGDLVWIHDYHLLLLPQMLREAAPDAAIGFFLHIPFPSPSSFRVLPRREELLRGLLGADFIGFHTHGHLQNFRSSLLRVLGLDSRMDRVHADGRFARIEALPIGIVPREFTDLVDKSAEVRGAREELRRRFQGRRILLAVDRLDYTKGLLERLRAFRRLLERSMSLREQVVLIQVAPPSRERIEGYRSLRREVNELVGEINGEFGTPGWTPVVFIRRGVSRPQLAALYAAAEVCWVSPLRDGMNLVAKEYVACQKGEGGVLVLSEFAGAAAEMGEALHVNPYDEERTAAAVERALDMSAAERSERMRALYGRVVRNDAITWGDRFLEGLRQSVQARVQALAEGPRPLPVAEAVAAFLLARRSLLLLDYDGTLVPFANRPLGAAPAAPLLELLARLASDPERRAVVVSGRPRLQLETWFGGVAGLWLAGEHGVVLRDPALGEWAPLQPSPPAGWKERVQPVLEHFVDRTPGSFVEEKEYSLVWHYRMADPDFGDWLANELVGTLEDLLAETELRAVRGQKSVEIRLTWASKGAVVSRMEELWPADFRLAVGDDRTDEDLFERLSPDAWSIHVGEGPSLARFRVKDPFAVRALLERFAAGA
jgi:trehalose 6-phosphate synthase/phosphatase